MPDLLPSRSLVIPPQQAPSITPNISSVDVGTNWGDVVQGWNDLAMDWYALLTAPKAPPPTTAPPTFMARQPMEPGTLLLVAGAVGVGIWLLVRR